MVLLWEQPNIEIEPEIEGWRPAVYISCAISLDGKLVSSVGDSRLSSFEDKVEVHKMRSQMDGILVGVNTIIQDDPHLTVSEKYYKSDRHPKRVVLDSKARVPLDAQVITRRREVPTIIFVSKEAPQEKVSALREKGVVVEEVSLDGGGKLDLREVLEILKMRHRVSKLMVEGGGNIIGSFLKQGLFDYMRVSINPVIFGEGIGLVQGVAFKTVEESPKLKLVRVEKLGWSIVLHYIRVE